MHDEYCLPSGRLPDETVGKPRIWQVWAGNDKMPEYLGLCRESVVRHNEGDFEIVLVNPDNLSHYIDAVHPAYDLLSYVHKSDYLRCELLHRYGGIYLDMDTLCFRSLKPFYELLTYYDIVNQDATPWGGIVGNSAFGPTRASSNATTQWSYALARHLDMRLPELRSFREFNDNPRDDPLRWEEILKELLAPVLWDLRKSGQLSCFRVPLQYFVSASESFTGTELFAASHPGILASDLHKRATLLILNNALYPAEFKQMTAAEVLDASTGLSLLIRRALGTAVEP